MIKTVLVALLLASNATPDPPITFSVCEELADVLMESVEDGYIKEHDAERIYKQCLKHL